MAESGYEDVDEDAPTDPKMQGTGPRPVYDSTWPPSERQILRWLVAALCTATVTVGGWYVNRFVSATENDARDTARYRSSVDQTLVRLIALVERNAEDIRELKRERRWNTSHGSE